MKRDPNSRSPSNSPRRLRRRVEPETSGGRVTDTGYYPAYLQENQYGGGSDARFITKLKSLSGPALPHMEGGVSVSDHEQGHLYVFGGIPGKGSGLYRLTADRMEWENLTPAVLRHASNLFTEDTKEEMPYLEHATLALFGSQEHRRLLIFGGEDISSNLRNEVYCVDLLRLLWCLVSVQGDPVRPRRGASGIIVNENNFFIFGGWISEDSQSYSFSLAVFNTLLKEWAWKVQDQSLPDLLQGSHSFETVPFPGGKKLLLVGLVQAEERYNVTKQHMVTFDTRTYTFAPEYHAFGQFPLSLATFELQPGLRSNEVFARGLSGARHLPLAKLSENIWSYRAFPDNEWRCIIRDIGPLAGISAFALAVLQKKAYLLLWDFRGGIRGVNAYVDLAEIVGEFSEV